MAKCPVCKSRKAKRKCSVTDTNEICSLCCGQTRHETTCAECTYYKPPQSLRKYEDIPAYSTMEMDANPHLQDCSMLIEDVIASLDALAEYKIKDKVPIRIYELLLDRYHFNDDSFESEDALVERGFHQVDEAIKNNLDLFDQETLIKVLGVLRFIAIRRTRGGREYLRVVNQFAGVVRIL